MTHDHGVPFEPLSKLEYDPFGNFDYAATERKIVERLMGGARVPYDAPRWSYGRAMEQARVTIGLWLAEAMGDLPSCTDCGTPVTEEFFVKARPHWLIRCTRCQQDLKLDRLGIYDEMTRDRKELVEQLAKSAGEKYATELWGSPLGDRLEWRR